MAMKQDIIFQYETKEIAEKNAKDLNECFGYKCKINKISDNKWELTGHTDEVMMG